MNRTEAAAKAKHQNTTREVRDVIVGVLEAQGVHTGGLGCPTCGWQGRESINGLVNAVMTHLIKKWEENDR